MGLRGEVALWTRVQGVGGGRLFNFAQVLEAIHDSQSAVVSAVCEAARRINLKILHNWVLGRDLTRNRRFTLHSKSCVDGGLPTHKPQSVFDEVVSSFVAFLLFPCLFLGGNLLFVVPPLLVIKSLLLSSILGGGFELYPALPVGI